MFYKNEIEMKNSSFFWWISEKKTVFRVSDGNGYPFLFAKKIEVNVATRAGGNAVARDTPKIL